MIFLATHPALQAKESEVTVVYQVIAETSEHSLAKEEDNLSVTDQTLCTYVIVWEVLDDIDEISSSNREHISSLETPCAF